MLSVSVIKEATSLTNVLEIHSLIFGGEVGTNVTIFVFGLALTFIQNLFKATGRFAN